MASITMSAKRTYRVTLQSSTSATTTARRTASAILSARSRRYAARKGSGCDSRIERKPRAPTSRLTTVSAKRPKPEPQRNGKLKIELPYEDALRAALETQAPPKAQKR